MQNILRVQNTIGIEYYNMDIFSLILLFSANATIIKNNLYSEVFYYFETIIIGIINFSISIMRVDSR